MRLFLSFGLVACFGFVAAQETPKSYYVVVTSFKSSQVEYAQNLVDKIKASGAEAGFVQDTSHPFCYVYTSRFSALDESLSQMRAVRQAGTYADAWVRILPDEGAPPVAKTTPATKKPTATVYVAIPKEVVQEAIATQSVAATAPAPEAKQPETVKADVVVENPPAEPVYIPQTLDNTQIFLSLVNPRNQKLIEGEIEVVDTERARSITKVKGNTYLTLPDPKSTSGQLTLICEAFGYRKTQHEINYKNTEADTLQPHIDMVGNFYLVKFDMVRLHKGDISVLYNVYFYNDAAIMRPESKFELNSLLNMMQENPDYKIILHGHTNGNATGKIITMGPSKDFFNFNAADRKDGLGSSKQLSEERAAAIKEWLVSQGIPESRMIVKAWGGGRMLHDKHSVHARKNVRVEVEILEE